MTPVAPIRFVDITHPNFDASLEGLDTAAVHKAMHLKEKNGDILTGVEAFAHLWTYFPKYRYLSKVVMNPLILPFAKLGYKAFARIRVYLPKKDRCSDSPYCDQP